VAAARCRCFKAAATAGGERRAASGCGRDAAMPLLAAASGGCKQRAAASGERRRSRGKPRAASGGGKRRWPRAAVGCKRRAVSGNMRG